MNNEILSSSVSSSRGVFKREEISDPVSIRRWLSGSAAAVAATAAGNAEARLVQIPLANNQITNTSNTINFDFTGDGRIDAPNWQARQIDVQRTSTTSSNTPGIVYYRLVKGVSLLSQTRYAPYVSTPSYFKTNTNLEIAARFLSTNDDQASPPKRTFRITTAEFESTIDDPAPMDVSEFVAVRFTDKRINRGASTLGFVQIRTRNIDEENHSIQLVRLVFDDGMPNLDPFDKPSLSANFPNWVDPTPLRKKLERQIKAANKKLARAKKSGNSGQIKSLTREIRTLKKRLRML